MQRRTTESFYFHIFIHEKCKFWIPLFAPHIRLSPICIRTCRRRCILCPAGNPRRRCSLFKRENTQGSFLLRGTGNRGQSFLPPHHWTQTCLHLVSYRQQAPRSSATSGSVPRKYMISRNKNYVFISKFDLFTKCGSKEDKGESQNEVRLQRHCGSSLLSTSTRTVNLGMLAKAICDLWDKRSVLYVRVGKELHMFNCGEAEEVHKMLFILLLLLLDELKKTKKL